MEDASLEDFLDGDPVADPGENSGADEGEEPGANEGVAPDQAEANSPLGGEESSAGAAADENPLVGTYEFTPSGAPCAACGDVVNRRWRDESGLVCPACKSW